MKKHKMKLKNKIRFNVDANGKFCAKVKTIEIDIANKIFNVNGIPFIDKCTGFNIYSAFDERGITINMTIDKCLAFESSDLQLVFEKTRNT